VSSALREGFVATVKTTSTRNMMKNNHPFARLEFLNVIANPDDFAGSFVAKNTGRRMRAAGNFLKVGPADTTSMDAIQNLSPPNLRHRNFFQSYVIDAAINHRP